ncbi:phosphoribosylformylglycinamidine cyclo-ligase [Vagococcus silagei]|uniref:Phosphoribosylformylglycinamidine cyclo-ligase n=1 Tax=Vagococcus silagei TaxID=2508885 RepID=A0A4S3B7L5_9ENTE|nr:phosphoribosylformylglycinamidine cyclo-ligase [Vagococcus silagei]THB62070.1 phosphoribosylformylglycinamidine cyclo-ligase [Vagococcus silagei]
MKKAYEAAGVNVDAGYEVVTRIKKHAQRTEKLGVMGHIGGFGGCFDLSAYAIEEPVLVSGTDGVGTKLSVAIAANQHDTIGIDCVAMCVNDIVAQGAKPLYFLDYLAVGKNNPEKIETIVSGIATGCVAGQMALIGGETAEMPDMYQEEDYDVAGFAVGIAEKSHLISSEKVAEGDLLIGLPSSGFHSNGFSLVRKILFKDHNFVLTEPFITDDARLLQDILLTPTKIYVATVLPLIERQLLSGVAHITGGGFYENLPRMLSSELAVEIYADSWQVPAEFKKLAELGQLSNQEMFEVFNMGIGMVLACSKENYEKVVTQLKSQKEAFYVIGKVVPRDQQGVLFVEAEA